MDKRRNRISSLATSDNSGHTATLCSTKILKAELQIPANRQAKWYNYNIENCERQGVKESQRKRYSWEQQI